MKPALPLSELSHYPLKEKAQQHLVMKKKVFIRILWIILVSLLVSYLTVAWVSGQWNVFSWKAHLVEWVKFIGGAS